MNIFPKQFLYSLSTKYIGYIYAVAFITTLILLTFSHALFIKQIDRQETVISIGTLTPKRHIIFQHAQLLVTEILDLSIHSEPSKKLIDNLKGDLARHVQELADITEIIHKKNFLLFKDRTSDKQQIAKETELFTAFQNHVAQVLAATPSDISLNFRSFFINNLQFSKLENAYAEGAQKSQQQMETSVATMRSTNGTLTIVIVLTIIGEALFIFWPLIKRLQGEYNLTLISQKILKHQAYHDDLTGIGNRKFFNERLKNKIRNFENSFVISILDLDNFKAINDTYGHQAGDSCLKNVANILRKNLREEDQVARLGGDEFVIIFNHFNKDDLKKTIYRIKQELLTISDKHYPDIPLSFSYGFATYPEDAKDFDTLISIADTKMYQQKRAIP